MVVQTKDTKTSSSLIDLLGGSAKSKSTKTNDVFAQLLSSLNAPLKGGKSFAVVVDSKTSAKDTKISEALKLIAKVAEEPLKSEEIKMIPKDVVSVLSNDQVRTLIQKAKEYLKSEITAKAPEYKIDIKTLPKTLMGLVELANKIGIDMSSITLSTVDDSAKTLSKELPASLLTKNILALKETPKIETSMVTKTFEAITQLLTEVKGVQAESKMLKEGENVAPHPLQSLIRGLSKTPTSAPVVQAPVATQPSAPVVQAPVATQISAPVVQAPVATQISAPVVQAPVATQISAPVVQAPVATQISAPVVQAPVATQISAPVVQAPVATQPSAPVVQTPVVTTTVQEIFKEIPKITTVASANILGALLQGKNEVDTIEKTKEKTSSMEESSKFSHVRLESSLEVKSKEAVQSLSHFATDLKEAAENYKPPFTRITMKLNPEKLGEVEVTLVQRGNNIHVNIQSANANSVTFLAHNALELKTQLAQQGVTNATMNFMSGGENQSQNPNPQHQQQQQNRFQSYTSLSDLESNGEQLSALEIILPHYA